MKIKESSKLPNNFEDFLGPEKVGAEIEVWNEDFLGPRPDQVYAFLPKINDSEVESNEESGEVLEFLSGHNRVLGTPIMEAKLNEAGYYYLDFKGLSNFHEYKYWFNPILMNQDINGDNYVRGMLDLESALKDHEITGTFERLGMRVNKSLGVLKLNEVVIGKKKYKISEITEPRFKKINGRKFSLPKDFVPVQQIRAFGSPYRLSVLSYSSSKDLLREAKKIVTRDIGLDGEMTDYEYLCWFAKTAGENIGKMHRAGYVHGNLHKGNFTLDGRLVDFDTVKTKKEVIDEVIEKNVLVPETSIAPLSEQRKRDYFSRLLTEDIQSTISNLWDIMQHTAVFSLSLKDSEDILKRFKSAYSKTLGKI